jgi:hypothetical protein
MFEELNKETLIRLYIKEHKTTREIAKTPRFLIDDGKGRM